MIRQSARTGRTCSTSRSQREVIHAQGHSRSTQNGTSARPGCSLIIRMSTVLSQTGCAYALLPEGSMPNNPPWTGMLHLAVRPAIFTRAARSLSWAFSSAALMSRKNTCAVTSASAWARWRSAELGAHELPEGGERTEVRDEAGLLQGGSGEDDFGLVAVPVLAGALVPGRQPGKPVARLEVEGLADGEGTGWHRNGAEVRVCP